MTILTHSDVAASGHVPAIIDSDVHVGAPESDPRVVKHLPQRWRDHLQLIGLRGGGKAAQRPRQRAYSHRGDSMPPGGGVPGSDPDFAREQLLDRFDMSGAVINDLSAQIWAGGKYGYPRGMGVALARAFNDYRAEVWFTSDPRWYSSIAIPYEVPDEAVKEIVRCKEGPDADRWVQVLLPPNIGEPLGNPTYWPILEACEAFRIPVGVHVAGGPRFSGTGEPSFYFEEHCDFGMHNFNPVASLIFEGCFDRFPQLKIALLELGWAWAPMFAWRLDATWRVLKDEVPHLQRLPSEYLRDHFWYTTQPMEEPDRPEWFDDVWAVFEQFGAGDKVMYSSDYPHWDFDEPDALPSTLPQATRDRILGVNASALYDVGLGAVLRPR